MSNAGYVYILANSSMPDLVKIGKTTRCPEQRAKELSRGTGIASPFFVAYHSYFNDCSFVEKYLHNSLENVRYSSNREFFNISIKDAIDHLISASSKFSHQEDDLSVSLEDSVLDKNPSEKYFKQAQLGYQSFEDKVELYETTQDLGCIKSYKELGKLYLDEYRFSDDDNEMKGIDYLITGFEKKDPFCFAELALYYHDAEESIKMIQGDDYIYDQDYSIGEWWEGYFDFFPLEGKTIYDEEEFLNNTKKAAFNYIQYCIYSERPMIYKSHVIDFVNEYVDRCIEEIKVYIDHIDNDYLVVIYQYKLDLNKHYLEGVLKEFSIYLNQQTKSAIKRII